MKSCLSLLALLAPLFCPNPVPAAAADKTPAFVLVVELTKTETSKDSNTSSHSVTLSGHRVSCQWKYRGYPDDKDETRSWTMSPAVHAKLLDYIRKHGLDRNLRETRSSAGIGLAVSVTWTLVLSGRTSVIHLHGMYNDWSKRNSKPCNLDNIALYHRIEAVVTALRNKNEYF